jgi:hypothetical protein
MLPHLLYENKSDFHNFSPHRLTLKIEANSDQGTEYYGAVFLFCFLLLTAAVLFPTEPLLTIPLDSLRSSGDMDSNLALFSRQSDHTTRSKCVN